MSWLSNLFSTKNSLNSRKAMSSTHEAFSLPTPSPTYGPPSGSLGSPRTAETPSSPYSYPPQSPRDAYNQFQSTPDPRSRQSSLLPLHNSPLAPLPPYPPLAQTWDRLRAWLSKEYPELGDTLNYGILPPDLAQIEMSFGFALPPTVRDSYLCVDGQEAESSAGCSEGLFFGLTLMPLEDVLEEWRFWREIDDDPSTGANIRLRKGMKSIPPGWIRQEYSSRGWIPLISDRGGNYLGIDMNPGEKGSVGQVIVFGRDFDTKVVMWRGDGPGGWAKWLVSFVEDLESGEGFELGPSADGSEDSEDEIGYGGYFYDGVGRGQGDTGGDAGTGGLRLTGEYKGWSVLEAWADRSMRKWQEHGEMPPTSPDKGKSPERDSVDLISTAAASGSGAEVPIPVLAHNPQPQPLSGMSASPLGNVTNRNRLPTIAITKPPPPMPLDVPTQDDFDSTVTPPDSLPASPDRDLEAGHGVSMSEFRRTPVGTRQDSAKPLTGRDTIDSPSSGGTSITVLPGSPVSRTMTESPELLPPPVIISPPDAPHLLDDIALDPPSAAIPLSQSQISRTPLELAPVKSEITVDTDEESPVLVDAEDTKQPPSPSRDS